MDFFLFSDLINLLEGKRPIKNMTVSMGTWPVQFFHVIWTYLNSEYWADPEGKHSDPVCRKSGC